MLLTQARSNLGLHGRGSDSEMPFLGAAILGQPMKYFTIWFLHDRDYDSGMPFFGAAILGQPMNIIPNLGLHGRDSDSGMLGSFPRHLTSLASRCCHSWATHENRIGGSNKLTHTSIPAPITVWQGTSFCMLQS